MSKLSNLLERAFENKGNKNHYSDGEWSIGFNERTWDTYFQLYYKNVAVVEGNTLDKELKLCNGSVYPIEKLIPEVEKALPEYHFNIRLSLMIPVDFNGRSLHEVENAQYVKTDDKVRFEDITEGYGYDVDIYFVANLSELKDVVIVDEEGTRYSIDEVEMSLGSQGETKIYPIVLAPIQQFDKNLYQSALEHFAPDANGIEHLEGVEPEKLIYCFENGKDLMDFDFWCRFESLCGEKISYDEFMELNSHLDGDPFDIDEQDSAAISEIRNRLNEYRATNAPIEKAGSLADKIANAEARASQQELASEKKAPVLERDN